MQIVSIDLGFGWLKASSRHRSIRIPAVTGPSRQLFDAPAGADPLDYLVHRDLDTNVETFVGSLAIRQSATRLHTLRPERAKSPGALTLFQSGLALVADSGPAAVVTGLPVTWYWLQREDMRRLAEGRHEVELIAAGEVVRRSVDVEKVAIVPQPLGAAADWVLDDSGNVARAEAGATIGVIDVGFHTCDYLLLKAMEIDRNGSQSTRSGLHVALRALYDAGLDAPLYTLDAEVQQGRYAQQWRMACHQLAQQITAEAETYWPQWPSAVLLAGGGAAALGEFFALRNAVTVDDPAHANARGYMKLGVKIYGADVSASAAPRSGHHAGTATDRAGGPERAAAPRASAGAVRWSVPAGAGSNAARPTGAAARR